MKDNLRIALSFFMWTSMIGIVLIIFNFMSGGSEVIIFILILMVFSFFLLVYAAVKYLLYIGTLVEEIRKQQNKD